MKVKLSKKLVGKLFVFALCLCGIVVMPHHTSYAKGIAVFPKVSEDIETRADHLGWKYKIENGKMYKRLFNYTRNRWETEWELVSGQ